MVEVNYTEMNHNWTQEMNQIIQMILMIDTKDRKNIKILNILKMYVIKIIYNLETKNKETTS